MSYSLRELSITHELRHELRQAVSDARRERLHDPVARYAVVRRNRGNCRRCDTPKSTFTPGCEACRKRRRRREHSDREIGGRCP